MYFILDVGMYYSDGLRPSTMMTYAVLDGSFATVKRSDPFLILLSVLVSDQSWCGRVVDVLMYSLPNTLMYVTFACLLVSLGCLALFAAKLP